MAIKKSELYSSLWKSCDELRGKMDASQYKDYVLILLFVKYVSDKYAGEKYAPIVIPEGGSFKDMVSLKGKKDIGKGINTIIAKLAEANELKGVIDVAEYGKALLANLAKDLTLLHGKGFSRSNLVYMRLFYQRYPISQMPSHQLSWYHYVELLKSDNDLERGFYEKQAIAERWSVAELKRQKGWSAAIIPNLSRDLRNELPEGKGFSERNLGHMLAFFRNYKEIDSFLPQPVAKLPSADLIQRIPGE